MELEEKIKTEEVERRTFPVHEIRASRKGDKQTFEGYAAVYNQYSQDLGGWHEIIEPGFFDEVMGDDVRCLLNHDVNFVLGRTKANTLELSSDDIGLFQRTFPPVVDPESAQWAKDFMVTLRRGEIDQQSFGFIVKATWRGDPEDGYVWEAFGDKIIRRLLPNGCKRLLDVSPVTYPAYLQTNVSATTRSQFQEFQKSIHPQAREDGKQKEWQEPLDSMRRRLELTGKD